MFFFGQAARQSDSTTISKIPDVHRASKKRVYIITGTQAALWTGTFVALNKAWYANFDRSRFHFYNDFGEWNQMDKAGHLWTSYHISRISGQMWQWTGLPEKTSAVLGGISGVAYQSIIEIQDGYSKQWGFSWGDMAANFGGAALFVSQELGWHNQRLQLKLSYSPYPYPAGLTSRRNELFGSTLTEQVLKDYNSQTYWLSANIRSFFPHSNLPPWLNVSAGYGSEGMLGGTQNSWIDKSGNTFNRPDIRRVRRWFIAPDVDLTKINTHHKWLQTVFFVFNLVKFPAPAFELDGNGKLKGHWVYF